MRTHRRIQIALTDTLGRRITLGELAEFAIECADEGIPYTTPVGVDDGWLYVSAPVSEGDQ